MTLSLEGHKSGTKVNGMVFVREIYMSASDSNLGLAWCGVFGVRLCVGIVG